jgi:hypothetical protein
MEKDAAKPRLIEANRSQIAWRAYDLDGCISEDHQVRKIWAVVEKLDVSEFEKTVLARGSEPGRPAIDPRILRSGCRGPWMESAARESCRDGAKATSCTDGSAEGWG